MLLLLPPRKLRALRVRLSATPGYARMPCTLVAACKRGAESSPSCGLSELCGRAELPALHPLAGEALHPVSALAAFRHHCSRGTAAYSRRRAECLVPWKCWKPPHWRCRCVGRHTRRSIGRCSQEKAAHRSCRGFPATAMCSFLHGFQYACIAFHNGFGRTSAFHYIALKNIGISFAAL